MKVPDSSCCHHRMIVKSCHGVACIAGEIYERLVSGGGSAIFVFAGAKPERRALICMFYFRPATRKFASGEALSESRAEKGRAVKRAVRSWANV